MWYHSLQLRTKILKTDAVIWTPKTKLQVFLKKKKNKPKNNSVTQEWYFTIKLHKCMSR